MNHSCGFIPSEIHIKTKHNRTSHLRLWVSTSSRNLGKPARVGMCQSRVAAGQGRWPQAQRCFPSAHRSGGPFLALTHLIRSLQASARVKSCPLNFKPLGIVSSLSPASFLPSFIVSLKTILLLKAMEANWHRPLCVVPRDQLPELRRPRASLPVCPALDAEPKAPFLPLACFILFFTGLALSGVRSPRSPPRLLKASF